MTIKELIDNAPAFDLNQEDRAPPFDFTDAGEFQGKDIAPRSWLVEGWIPKRAVTLLYGDGGVGKSLIALQLGVSGAIAGPWVGLPVERTKTLYFSCEDEEDEVARRLVRINVLHGVDFADLAGEIAIVDRVGKDNALMDYDSPENGRSSLKTTKTFESLNRTALDFGAGLVILDSLQDVFGGDENNRVETRRFMSALAWIALNLNSGAGGSIVVLAHPSRTGQSFGESGSTAWSASCRSRLHFKRPDPGKKDGVVPDRNERALENPESNYGPDKRRLSLRWQDGAFVRSDTDQGGFVGRGLTQITTSDSV
jgi:RecA-family ATPase